MNRRNAQTDETELARPPRTRWLCRAADADRDASITSHRRTQRRCATRALRAIDRMLPDHRQSDPR